MKKTINRPIYNPPIMRVVSFVVEQGFAGTIVTAGTAEPLTEGTQQLDNGSGWEVTWRQSAN